MAKVLDVNTKFAHLGKPGSIFSKGFERRLQKTLQFVDFQGKVILDQGCGEGVWMYRFLEFTDSKNIYGQDIDPELIGVLKSQSAVSSDSKLSAKNFVACPAEKLVFPDDKFDIVFSNEVLEHVEEDQKAVDEAWRVLKPGGKFIVFTPNSGWPFETHGIFFRNKYYWGNIPLLPWLPKAIQRRFAPHVRNYTNKEIKKLFSGEKWRIVHHSHVFPGFDGAVRRFGVLGKIIQRFFHLIEKTPLNWFGISHFLIAEKRVSDHGSF